THLRAINVDLVQLLTLGTVRIASEGAWLVTVIRALRVSSVQMRHRGSLDVVLVQMATLGMAENAGGKLLAEIVLVSGECSVLIQARDTSVDSVQAVSKGMEFNALREGVCVNQTHALRVFSARTTASTTNVVPAHGALVEMVDDATEYVLAIRTRATPEFNAPTSLLVATDAVLALEALSATEELVLMDRLVEIDLATEGFNV
ncbi:unnamed protein product, partial [Allacma fusca]